MTVRIEVAELGLPAIDALDVDAVAVFVGPERPLQGFAGFADWRLCGALSRAIRGDVFGAAPGEALLLPSGGRIRPPRVFCFGLPPVPLAPEAFAETARRACEALQRAGSDAFATSLPPTSADPATAARAWLEAAIRFPVGRQVLLGEARALLRDLQAAKATIKADAEILAPPSRVEMPARGRASPPMGAVIR
jgi:hypothetical protein